MPAVPNQNKSLTDIAKIMQMEHILPYMQMQVNAENQAQVNKATHDISTKKQDIAQKIPFKGSLASLLKTLR